MLGYNNICVLVCKDSVETECPELLSNVQRSSWTHNRWRSTNYEMGRHHPGLALEPIELQELRTPEPGIRKAQKEHILRGGVGHLHQCSQAFHETQELKSSNLVLLDLAIKRSRGTLEFTYMWWKKIQAVFCYEMSGRWGRGDSQVYKTHSRIWLGNGATERVSLQPDLWKVKPPIKVLVKSLSPPSFSLQSPWLHLPLLNSSRALSYTLLTECILCS